MAPILLLSWSTEWKTEGEKGFQHPVLCGLPSRDNPGQLNGVLTYVSYVIVMVLEKTV